MLRQLGIIAVLSLIVVALAVPAWAAKPGTGSTSGNPHYVGDAPDLILTGDTVTVSGGKIAGLGSGPATFLLTVSGLATTECQNPSGNVAPGQDSAFTLPGDPVIVPTDDRGSVTVPSNVTASGPEPGTPVSDQQAGAPNPKWECYVTGSTITSATLTVSQNNQVIPSLTVTETF